MEGVGSKIATAALDLGNEIKLKTLLVYPPGGKLRLYPVLAIPQLRAFLESKGYRYIQSVDLTYIWTSYPKLACWYQGGICVFKYLLIALYNIRHSRYYKRLWKRHCCITRMLVQCFGSFCEEQDIFRSMKTMIRGGLTSDAWRRDSAYRRIKALVESQGSNIVGLSVTFPQQVFHSLQLAKMIKTMRGGGVFVVMGGVQVTENINDLTAVEGMTDVIDAFVVGDGELPLQQLILTLDGRSNGGLEHVPNMYYKDKWNGYTRAKGTVMCDAKSIALPQFEGFYCTILPIRISLGCYWGRCAFCTYRLAHYSFSHMDIVRAIVCIRKLRDKYSISHFKLVDDLLPPSLLCSFSATLIRAKLRIRWECNTGFVKGFDKNSIDIMALSGCSLVSMGLESMCDRVLRLMEKPHTAQDAIAILHFFRGTGIHVRLSTMFGFPTETRDEAMVTLDFLRKYRGVLFSSVGIHQFHLQPNTKVFMNPESFGIREVFKEERWCGSRYGYRYVVRQGMSQDEARAFIQRARKYLGLS